jgi:DNA polymerase-3 subunit delta'
VILASLVGQQRARELLARALRSATVHPAYLFAGPPGVGKHLAAAEFARAWLCLREGPEPCGECESCRKLGGGAHGDFIEVAPDKNKKSIGVGQVRDLGEWLAQSPALGRRKAAIVDPADRMTLEAANALLKTLEEPPPGRVLVHVATRPGGLPPTVRSRCQQVSFGPLADAEVSEVLRRNGWPEQAARQAAGFSDGSPGAVLARDGGLWQDAADAVRAVCEALGEGDRGAALAFAEARGEPRERALLALQALIGVARQAARRRLGDEGVDVAALPLLLRRMDGGQVGRLLGAALEVQRRLEGDRPPNAKLALATLLADAAAQARP